MAAAATGQTHGAAHRWINESASIAANMALKVSTILNDTQVTQLIAFRTTASASDQNAKGTRRPVHNFLYNALGGETMGAFTMTWISSGQS